MVNRLGKVDDGTTVTDFDEEEIARKHTLSASLAYAEWNKHKINLIDTPGFGNFLSDALRGAARGRRGRSSSSTPSPASRCRPRRCGKRPTSYELPRLVVAQPRSTASAPASTRSARVAAGGRSAATVIPIQLPIGEEKAFRGVVDLVAHEGVHLPGRRQRQVQGRRRSRRTCAGEAQAAREALVEMVAEADDKLMEKFFEAGTLTQEELVSGLQAGVAAGKIFPLFCTSSGLNIGIQPLLDAILAYVPVAGRPRRSRRVKGGEEVDGPGRARAAPYAAFVWKTIADPFAGRITMFRVVSGTLKADSTVHNLTRDAPERLGHLRAAPGQDADGRARRSRPATSARSRS